MYFNVFYDENGIYNGGDDDDDEEGGGDWISVRAGSGCNANLLLKIAITIFIIIIVIMLIIIIVIVNLSREKLRHCIGAKRTSAEASCTRRIGLPTIDSLFLIRFTAFLNDSGSKIKFHHYQVSRFYCVRPVIWCEPPRF